MKLDIRLLVGLPLLWLPLPATAHEGHDHEPIPQKPAETYRPTKVPDRIILTWTGDPATTQAVTWRTDDTVPKGLAQLAVAEDGPGFVEKATSHPATTQQLKSDLNTANYHTVEFKDLTPATKYVYRVGDGANWSEWSHFVTASAGAEPFSFIYFGDAQNHIKSLWSRVIREAYGNAPKARFMLHAGDLISHANSDAEWGEWFYAGGWLNRSIPSIATPGNHEYASFGDKRSLSGHWRPMFAFPTHGPEGLEETVYHIDYQGTRVISLNSNIAELAQIQWLEKTLKENPCRWTVITFHHPIYSAAKSRDNPLLRAVLQPLFDKYGVDLVLTGHDHTYARSKLLPETNVAAGQSVFRKQSGTVYVVSVSGPKMYALGERKEFVRAVAGKQLFQIISINGGELQYEARTATGELYDAFTLKQREDQPNELINQIPQERQPPAGE